MPTFYNKNNLTEEQKNNFSHAEIEYQKVQDINMKAYDEKEQDKSLRLLMNHIPGEKSALFNRLLDGDKPLKYPPPCSYSYPWYDIIEKDEAHEIFEENKTIKEFLYKGFGKKNNKEEAKQVLINQTPWDLIEIVSDVEAIISYPNWKEVGFKWKLTYEAIPSMDTKSFMLAHHNPKLKRITTLEQLYNEKRWHIIKRLDAINLILDLKYREEYKEQMIEKNGMGFGLNMFNSQLEQGQKILDERKKKLLPDYPIEEEIDKMTKESMQSCLDRNYSADDNGNLFVRTWVLKKIAPQDYDIYLD